MATSKKNPSACDLSAADSKPSGRTRKPAADATGAAAEPKLTAQDLRRMIAELYGIVPNTDHMSQEWALFFELRNGTGHGRQERYVDAFAINLYPSKGFFRAAFEIKVARSDFLSELKKPEKRQFAYDISNEFWYVTTPGVAKPEEIPEGCGLMVVHGNKLKRVVQARQRQPRDLTMAEVAAFARASCRYDILTSQMWRYQGTELDESALKDLVARRKDSEFYQSLREQVAQQVAEQTEAVRRNLERFVEQMNEVGVTPPDWMVRGAKDTSHLGGGTWEARNWVRDNVKPGPNQLEVAKALERLTGLSNRLTRSLDQVTSVLADAQAGLAEATDELKKL